MPCNSMEEARNEMFRLATVGLPSGLKIIYQGLVNQAPAKATDQWVRVTINHELGFQNSLADQSRKKSYNRSGVIIIQCFGPLSDRGFTKAQSLAESAVQAYQGKTGAGGIWFRNCRANEIGSSGAWFQINVSIDFTYTQYS